VLLTVLPSLAFAADFFYNDVTGKSQWEEPEQPVAYEDEKGQKYWYDSSKDESSWEFPGPWQEVQSEEHGQPYFFNKDTESTTWEKPEELGWRRVTKDEL